MIELQLLAEKTMDLYYGDLKHNDQFFDVEDFMFYCAAAYGHLLQEAYQQAYRGDISEGGNGSGILNTEWFIPETVTFKRRKDGKMEGTLEFKPFSFKYDRSFVGVDGIEPIEGCGDFIKSRRGNNWMKSVVPKHDKVRWYPEGQKIIVDNIQCNLESAIVYYLPCLDNKCAPVSEAFADDVMRRTLNLMFEARKGNVPVDKTADGNDNKVLETEMNPIYTRKTS